MTDVGSIVGYVTLDTSGVGQGRAEAISQLTQLASQGESAANSAGGQISAGLAAGIAALAQALSGPMGRVTADINSLGSQGGSLATASGHQITAGLEAGLAGLSAAADSEVSGLTGALNGLGSQGGSEATAAGHEITAGAEQGLTGLGEAAEAPASGILGSLQDLASSGAGKAAAAGLAIGAAMVAALKMAMADEDSTALLEVQLDLTVEEAGRLGKLAGQLYANNYGESMDDMKQVLRGVVSDITETVDATDDQLTRYSASAVNIATVTGEEAGRITQIVGRLLKTGLAKDADEAFDLILAASQKASPQLQGDMLDIVDEYAKDFEAIGISGKTAFGVLAASSEDGAIALDKTGDALKEFALLATDMGPDRLTAFRDLGLSAQEMSDDLLAGGDKAQVAFQKIVTGLLAIPNPTTQANTAIMLFGTPLEDLGKNKIPEFLARLQDGQSGLEDFAGSASDANDVLGGTASAGFASFMRSLEMTALEIGQELLPALEPLLGLLSDMAPILGVVVDVLTPFLELLGFVGEKAGWLIDKVGTALTELGEMVGLLDEPIAKIQNAGLANTMTEIASATTYASTTQDTYVAGLEATAARVAGVITGTNGATVAQDSYVAALEATAARAAEAETPIAQMNAIFAEQAGILDDVKTAGDNYTAFINQLLGISPSAEEAAQNLNDAMRDGKKAFEDATKATDGNIESLVNSQEEFEKTGERIDTTTEAGSKWKDSLDKQASAAQASTATALALGLQNGTLATAFQGARDAADQARAKFIESNKGMDGGTVAAGQLADSLGIVEGIKLTDKQLEVIAAGIEEAKADIADVDNTPVNGVSIPVTANTSAAETALSNIYSRWNNKQVTYAAGAIGGIWAGGLAGAAAGFADGGLLPGTAPSDPTVDNLAGMVGNVPIRLRSKEFVTSEPAVDYYGVQAMYALNARRVPREVLQGYAGGGQPGGGSTGVSVAAPTVQVFLDGKEIAGQYEVLINGALQRVTQALAGNGARS